MGSTKVTGVIKLAPAPLGSKSTLTKIPMEGFDGAKLELIPLSGKELHQLCFVENCEAADDHLQTECQRT
jgi:hypothetical protein